MEHQHHFVCIQTFGFISGPWDDSAGARGSRLRANAAAELVRTGVIPWNSMAIFPQKFGLGDQVWKYFKSRLPPSCGISQHVKKQSWGTLNDIIATYDMVAELITWIPADDTVHLHFVTDPDHLERVRMIVESTRPAHWIIHYHPAEAHRMSWFDRKIREPLAYLKDRGRLCLRKVWL